MPRPTDAKGVQTFLGCVNYLLQFIPNLSEVTEPLRQLTQTEKFEFAWQSRQEEAFAEIKRLLTRTPTLAYFDQSRPIIIQTDASNFGLGGVLLQEGKPVAYTSHTLSKTEQNYLEYSSLVRSSTSTFTVTPTSQSNATISPWKPSSAKH